jgi:nitronate monooxygenase
MGIQVVGRENALAAMQLGPDFLICQGTEAGGHVQAYQPLAIALEEVLSVADGVPVAASGGMATGRDMRRWISAGAAAVVFGTRFVATEQSAAHPEYKQLLLAGSAGDTVFTVCLNKVWQDATHRILKNDTFRMWEAAGCPKAGCRPGEFDIIAIAEDGTTFERYVGNVPVEGMMGIDVTGLGVYAGLGVTEIHDLPSASDLIPRLWSEYLT